MSEHRASNIIIGMKDVTAAVIENSGRILIARRRQGLYLAGKWEFPGGKVEKGETPEACLRRELREEFGIDVEIGNFIAASEFDYGAIHIRLLAYHVYYRTGDFILSDHSEVQWVPKSELVNYDFAEADKPIVCKIQDTER